MCGHMWAGFDSFRGQHQFGQMKIVSGQFCPCQVTVAVFGIGGQKLLMWLVDACMECAREAHHAQVHSTNLCDIWCLLYGEFCHLYVKHPCNFVCYSVIPTKSWEVSFCFKGSDLFKQSRITGTQALEPKKLAPYLYRRAMQMHGNPNIWILITPSSPSR